MDENVRLIPLSKGKFAIVDAGDYNFLMQWKWCFKSGYACRVINQAQHQKSETIIMHRFLMDTPQGMDTDHVDGNGLNNCRSNLRIATRSQNHMNRRKGRRATSKFKGVSLLKKERKWGAFIKHSDRRLNLGSFKSEEMAAAAYNDAASKLFGSFARLNEVSFG